MLKNGFVPMRRGLIEHINMGGFSLSSLGLYTYLQYKADFGNGVVEMISGAYIKLKFGEKELRTVNRLMSKLEAGGYIKRFKKRGQITPYCVLINKFQTSNGLIIDSDISTDINNIAFRVAPQCLCSDFAVTLKRPGCDFGVSTYKEIKNIKTKRREEGSSLFSGNKDQKEDFRELPF